MAEDRERTRQIVEEIGKSLDRRFVIMRVESETEDGENVLRGFVTDRSVIDRLTGALADAGVAASTSMIRCLEPRPARAIASVINLRCAPSHKAPLETQALLGDPLEILDEKDSWLLVRAPDGYLGWCDSPGIVEPTDEERRCWERFPELVVTARDIPIRSTPEKGAVPVRDAVFDSRLFVRSRKKGWIQVELPDGVVGWIEEGSGRTEDESRAMPKPGKIIAAAKKLIGVPYLWGGSSTKGFDCSGLIQRLFSHFGIEIPRDSDLQEEATPPLPEGSPRKEGDLLFFGEERVTHVALSLGGADFIHASGWVRIESLNGRSPAYRGDLKAIYRGARRPAAFSG